jgi:alpha-galactosidase
MNSGNAGHTGNGLAHIEEWLDLKRYLQSGQEYLQLVDSVKDMLAHPELFIPNYKNQGVELAGMVWFQGIADSQSNAFSAAYEKNLACLIRDVRKEFKAPTLPVVVTGIGFGGTTMNANTKKIHDAQMAVGNPEKYPEFAGNVKSIDTLPLYRASEISPGGGVFSYNSNAESFLLIGEAMGRAMLDLTKDKK